MNAQVNYALVGLFVLVLAAAVIVGGVWLSTGGVATGFKYYLMYLEESVTGLSVDAPVRYRGVRVGRVASIDLAPGDPTRVRLFLAVESDTPVKTDTVGTLEMQGLTGLKTVNLTGGSAEAPLLRAPPGQRYPVIPSKPSLTEQLEDRATQLVESLTTTAENLGELLDAPNREHINRTLAHLEQLTATLVDQSAVLRATLENTRAASAELPALMRQFRATADALENMATKLARSSGEAGEQLAASARDVHRFTRETLPEAGAMVDELRETAANLRRMSESLERNPSQLLYGSPAPRPGPGE